MVNVVFAHGMESSPEGTKARYLREVFDAHSPWLGELNLTDQVDALVTAVGEEDSAVVVGSSLGGLAALGLTARHPERIAQLILLAPAVGVSITGERRAEVETRRPGLVAQLDEFSDLAIPAAVPASVIHGLADDVVATTDVISLVRRSPSARLLLIHDDHPLSSSEKLILEVVARAVAGRDPLAPR